MLSDFLNTFDMAEESVKPVWAAISTRVISGLLLINRFTSSMRSMFIHALKFILYILFMKPLSNRWSIPISAAASLSASPSRQYGFDGSLIQLLTVASIASGSFFFSSLFVFLACEWIVSFVVLSSFAAFFNNRFSISFMLIAFSLVFSAFLLASR